MHCDVDRLLSTVDDLQLDAQVIDRRYKELFKEHNERTLLGAAVQHFTHFDVHAARPNLLSLSVQSSVSKRDEERSSAIFRARC